MVQDIVELIRQRDTKKMNAQEMSEALGDDPMEAKPENVGDVVQAMVARIREAIDKEFGNEFNDPKLEAAFLAGLGIYTGTKVVEVSGLSEVAIKGTIATIALGHKLAADELRTKNGAFFSDNEPEEEDWDVFMADDESP